MAITTVDLTARHVGTRHIMATLRPNPALDGVAMEVSVTCWEAAARLVSLLGDGPELTAGLRKLREAKDCLVIQGLLDTGMISAIRSGDVKI